MTRLLVVSAVALAAITFSLPEPAQAQSQPKPDGIRNIETTDFSARRRHHRRWGAYAFPFFAGAALAAVAAPRYYHYPRYYPRYYYQPAYHPYYHYPRHRYYRRPGISVSFGFGGYPYWW